MMNFFASVSSLLFFILSLTGYNTTSAKSSNLSFIYGIAAILSLLLLIGCACLVRKKRFWFITLFSSVLVVNTGYTLLSISSNLETALWANRISYLGSVFLPFSMLMIILNQTNTLYKKCLPKILFCVAILVFLIAASPGVFPFYYKDVSFAVINGVSTLVKVYGPLHPIYLFYLLGYFSAMIAIIIRANIQKTINTTSHAIIIAIAVFVNIGVWFIEQLVAFNFEMLSISYIISELFLLGAHLVMNENQHLRELVKQVEDLPINSFTKNTTSNTMLEKPIDGLSIDPEQIENFMIGLKSLTPSERTICDAYIARMTTKEIMANMNIKESTLKYHSRNIYGKLGVSNRKELLEVHKHIKSIKTKLENVHD